MAIDLDRKMWKCELCGNKNPQSASHQSYENNQFEMANANY